METPPEHAQALANLPAGLRTVLEAELKAGNAIAEIGTGFPAAPVGFWVRLCRPFQVAQRERPAEIEYYERNTSTWSEEVNDLQRHFFLLSTARPQPEPPSMEELRTAHTPKSFEPVSPQATRQPDVPSQVPSRDWWIEVDGRGEMMTYREPSRRAEIFWGSMTSGAIERASLRGWYSDGPFRPITSKEEDLIIDRIVEGARKDHGINVSLR